MSDDGIFLPVLIQVLLTIVMYILLGVAKARAAKRGEVDHARKALHGDAWPECVIKINNNIRNQFEVPVLFYVVAIVLWILDAAGPLAYYLAWTFVASRVIHAYIHIGPNYVPIRRAVFTFGCLVLLIMLVLAFMALDLG